MAPAAGSERPPCRAVIGRRSTYIWSIKWAKLDGSVGRLEILEGTAEIAQSNTKRQSRQTVCLMKNSIQIDDDLGDRRLLERGVARVRHVVRLIRGADVCFVGGRGRSRHLVKLRRGLIRSDHLTAA
jgi:hypothetical protein